MLRPQLPAKSCARSVAGPPPGLGNSFLTSRAPGSTSPSYQRRDLQRSPTRPTRQGLDLEKRKEWMAFLRNSCLLHHADVLLRHGFDDLETLGEIGNNDLKELGIPAHDAARLQKSLQHLHGVAPQADDNHPVVVFLRDCGLQQYAEILFRHGFDDMEALLEIQDSDMRDLGFPRGHALKLAKRLRDLGTNVEAKVEVCPVPPLPTLVSRSVPACAQQKVAATSARSLQGPRTTEAQHSAVQRSWRSIEHLGSCVFGEKLYLNVFRIAPQVMELFPPEVRLKYRDWTEDEACEEGDLLKSPALKKLFGKVVNAVGVSVAGLRQPSQMVPMLKQLGARHVGYGLQEEYWKVLGDALIQTLGECLGEEFRPEVQIAWTLVYGFISAVMIEGFRGSLSSDSGSVRSEGSTFHRSVSDEKTMLPERIGSDRSEASFTDGVSVASSICQ